MEITVKEFHANFHGKFSSPPKVLEVRRIHRGGFDYIHIITEGEVSEKEGLELALPYILEGRFFLKDLINRFVVYGVGRTHQGSLYYIADEKYGEDIGVLYQSEFYSLELPGLKLEKGGTLRRYIFSSLLDEAYITAYIIPRDLIQEDFLNE